MLRLWPSEIICCHQQYLTHLKYGNSKVLLPTFHKLISIAQIFLRFCLSNSSTSFFEQENFECIILHYKSTFFISSLLHTADLGHQTAQRIVQASDPLQSMQEINQNFPSIVSSLSRMKVLLHLTPL